MNKYIQDLIYVISNCNKYDNTYKMSWIKSIVECCINNPNSNKISFQDISHNMFKYYWDQTIFFNLQQGTNPNKPPVFESYVKDKIVEYQNQYGKQPVQFLRLKTDIDIDYNKLIRTLKQDVCSRFLNVNGKTYSIYKLDSINSTIKVKDSKLISEYHDLLFELINFKWTQMLEDFNSSPRISKKVRVIDKDKIKRGSLSKFKKYLIHTDNDCFICHKPINENLSIDHIIPWSYMYSDDLWNLVNTHKNCNSSKSNSIVSEEVIKNLEERNKTLLGKLVRLNIKDKHVEELKNSIEKDFVRKFWIGYK